MSQKVAMPDPVREERYRDLLLSRLAGRELKEILFFVNPRRFALLDRSIGDVLRRPGMRVLNVAGGPFALEFYLAGLQADIVSVDLDPALPALHRDLVAGGLIRESAHTCSDVLDYQPEGSFDLIIINDLFYSREVDFTAVFEKYRHALKPDGVLYFDILDERASTVWRAFNKDARFRRYAIAEVRDALHRAGFRIEHETPSFGIKGGPDALARRLMWHGLGIANNLVFTARRKRLSAMIAAIAASFGVIELDYLLV